MNADMAPGAPLVIELLNYIEQVEKLKTKPAFSVPTEYFDAHEHELRGLPELSVNLQSEGDDVWLRIPRLQEIPAPEPDEALKPWLNLPKLPEKQPDLKREIVLLEGKREVGREQLENHPEIRELFDWYQEYQWTPWAETERVRRKTIARYNRLFSLQQAIASDGAETPLELVWGIGYATWKKEGFATPVKYPLLVQSCEVTLNERSFDLEVRPRDIEPRLEADCYVEMELPGVKQLEAYWRNALASGAHRVNPFEPDTFEGTLKAAVGYLDPTGKYVTLDSTVAPSAPSDALMISSSWVLFGRKRSGDIFLEDIKRLKKKVEQAPSLPNVIRSLVERGDSTVRVRPEQPFRGLASSDSVPNASELFFPMPYNDEQVSIVQKLYANDGVVVQGPPGTGKTHTIANVICHYLAQGKRVLVTAKGESALSVLQEKLPQGIRPLSVSLLSDERDGMKQFEHAIQTIASRVASLDPTRTASSIAAAEEKLNQLHAKISVVDQTVAARAAAHMRTYEYQGRKVTAEDLAKHIIEGVELHQWFDDEPALQGESALQFDETSVNALRRARMAVGHDLSYLDKKVPRPSRFPSWSEVLGLHRDLVKAKSIEASVSEGNLLALVDSRSQTFESAQKLVAFLDARMSVKARLANVREAWLESLIKRLTATTPDDPGLHALLAVLGDIQSLEQLRREFLAKAIEAPEDAETNPDFIQAVTRLASGKSAFSLPLGKGDARKAVAAVSVAGAVPTGNDAWQSVSDLIDWRVQVRKVLARWKSLASDFALAMPDEQGVAGFKSLSAWQPIIEDARQLTVDFDAHLHPRVQEVFGKSTADRLQHTGELFVASIFTSLHAHVDKGRLAYGLNKVQELISALDGCTGSIVDGLRAFFTDSLGSVTVDEAALQTAWLQSQAELSRIIALQPHLDAISNAADAIESSGAPKWARRLRTEPATVDLDTVAPGQWHDSWRWRQAVMLLEQIDGHQALRALFEDRRTLTVSLARTYQDLVAEKTWLGVFNNSPDAVRQALQAYLNAVQAMGAGTGLRAVRHRRTARDAMAQAYQAVPCWVLPQWRVSETIPPEVGLFDLVVIDEASQSDIWALPALLRGKKVLVVGDHKQVSPSAVGTAEEKVKELVGRFLGNQPFGSEMTPDKSIYDLARVVFAGNSVMLKEHFRCVPAIIEFSNREFYQNDIRALRVPKANERLDPPLVDVFVKGGFRKGDVNAPEAMAIVKEIQSILADHQFNGRTIGVVTLLGTAQAAAIHELIASEISPMDIVARKIAVGPPPVFQGRERDIMMVSMVLGPGDRSAANRADIHQRFNVALSRARDRMYLFRSVHENEFKEDSLNAKVISHFKQPFHHDIKKVLALREKCESCFELEMFDELTRRGYRVEPQVPCGGYRIDFVVEGNEGRRLAVECDGDRFHGPGQWQDDMARQRVLERAGWTFWRCFASTFVRRRDEVIFDLLQTLDKLGIAPIGSEATDNSVWVHYKEVDPYAVAEEAAEATEVTSTEAT